jgi:hypothetical protein
VKNRDTTRVTRDHTKDGRGSVGYCKYILLVLRQHFSDGPTFNGLIFDTEGQLFDSGDDSNLRSWPERLDDSNETDSYAKLEMIGRIANLSEPQQQLIAKY